MRPVQVDFAPPPHWPRMVSGVLSLVFAAVAGFECWRGLELHGELGERRARLAAIESDHARNVQRLQEDATVRAKPPAYAADADAVARLASFPLPNVLRSLESTIVAGIQVFSLELSASEGTARTEIEFSDHGTLLQFVAQLNDGEPVARWRLLQARVASSSGNGRASLISNWLAMK